MNQINETVLDAVVRRVLRPITEAKRKHPDRDPIHEYWQARLMRSEIVRQYRAEMAKLETLTCSSCGCPLAPMPDRIYEEFACPECSRHKFWSENL